MPHWPDFYFAEKTLILSPGADLIRAEMPTPEFQVKTCPRQLQTDLLKERPHVPPIDAVGSAGSGLG